MIETDKIPDFESAILNTLRTAFPEVDLISATIKKRDDADDEYLWVDVVFDGSPANKAWSLGAVRILKPVLARMGEEAFPVLSFITQADAAELTRESA
jgi:hypothetical protein